MTDYLLNRRSRGYYPRIFRFCWDVKIWAADFTGKGLRKHFPDLDVALDSAWDSHFQSDDSLFWTFCEMPGGKSLTANGAAIRVTIKATGNSVSPGARAGGSCWKSGAGATCATPLTMIWRKCPLPI